jgi:hypothetical protein
MLWPRAVFSSALPSDPTLADGALALLLAVCLHRDWQSTLTAKRLIMLGTLKKPEVDLRIFRTKSSSSHFAATMTSSSETERAFWICASFSCFDIGS